MHSELESEFARILTGIEKRAGLSHQRIADAAGVDRSQVWRWVRAGTNPGYEPVRRLAAWLIAEHPEVADEAASLLTAAGYETPPPAVLPVAANSARLVGIDPDDPDDPWTSLIREQVEGARRMHGDSPTGSQIFYGEPASSVEAGIWDNRALSEKSKIMAIAILRAMAVRDSAGSQNHGRSGRAGLALVTLALR